MKRELIFVLLIGAVVLAFDYPRPQEPAEVIEAVVLSVEDAEEGNGWRHIVVKMPDDSNLTIRTLAPFFYRVGYRAHVGKYKRRIFPDVYDVVAPPDGALESASP